MTTKQKKTLKLTIENALDTETQAIDTYYGPKFELQKLIDRLTFLEATINDPKATIKFELCVIDPYYDVTYGLKTTIEYQRIETDAEQLIRIEADKQRKNRLNQQKETLKEKQDKKELQLYKKLKAKFEGK